VELVSLVRGHRLQVGTKGSVFVGFKDDSTEKYIRFINQQGDETYIRLSRDAGLALAKLLRNDLTDAAEETVTVRSKTEFHWVHVRDPERQA
jgi:hypothetical protein